MALDNFFKINFPYGIKSNGKVNGLLLTENINLWAILTV